MNLQIRQFIEFHIGVSEPSQVPYVEFHYAGTACHDG